MVVFESMLSVTANDRAVMSQRRRGQVCSSGVKDKQEVRCHWSSLALAVTPLD